MANVVDIVQEYGAYYAPGSQNLARLIKMIMMPSETAQEFNTIITDETLWKGARAQIGSVLQGFHKKFTPKGEMLFTPRQIQNYHLKVDFTEYPDDIEATWLGFLADNNLARAEWPLIRYIMEQFLMDKIDEDFEMNEAFYGEFSAPNGVLPGDDGESMNGLRKTQDLAIAAGDMNEVITGALDPDDIVDQVRAFVDGRDAKFKKVPMELYMAQEWVDAFRDKYSSQFGTNLILGDANKMLIVPNRNVTIKSLASMAGSERIWMTMKWNRVRMLKKSVNKYNFKVEEQKREVAIMSDWWECLDYYVTQYVFANDRQ